MKYAFIAISSYLGGWIIVYTIIMVGDFRYFFEYLYLAWVRPGELPVFINIGAIIVALATTIGFWGYFRFRSKVK